MSRSSWSRKRKSRNDSNSLRNDASAPFETATSGAASRSWYSAGLPRSFACWHLPIVTPALRAINIVAERIAAPHTDFRLFCAIVSCPLLVPRQSEDQRQRLTGVGDWPRRRGYLPRCSLAKPTCAPKKRHAPRRKNVVSARSEGHATRLVLCCGLHRAAAYGRR